MGKEKVILILLLSTMFSCSKNPVDPVKSLPDLIFNNITYSHNPGRLRGTITDSIYIQNIGEGDFYGFLYVAQASEKYFSTTGLFSQVGLLYSEWDSNNVKPARILPGQTVKLIWGSLIPNDTNVVRFHIATDTMGIRMDVPLPTYPETNYLNNDYLLTINQ
ncbi:MAG: hypothetical protein ACM34J_01815 [Ignavibacteria bacterium]